jgi:hypothetical protein
MLQHSFLFGKLLLASTLFVSFSVAITVSSTILVFARDQASSYSATSGLNAYGIPYELVLVPIGGITLPTLNSSATAGNYGGIITLSEVSYEYSDGWYSAINTTQWQQIYDYQTAFGVRLVRLDVYPDGDFGCTTTVTSQGCCDTAEQLLSFTDVSAFPTAGLNVGATMSTVGLWHYPATITDPTTTVEIAAFAPATGGDASDSQFTTTSTAAVINTFGTRQQLVWFTSWATDWAATSNFIMHAHIHWMTRGLYVGFRRVYFQPQVDDMHLATYLYIPDGGRFRARPSDMAAHVAWQADLNSRLPAGSSFTVEIGHNGNGDIEWAVNNETVTGVSHCNPDSEIQYDAPADPPLEFQKPLGTGTDLWPTTPSNYTWSYECAAEDTLMDWFMVAENRDAFWHISHTFTHENLNNSTYSDTVKEIQFNQAWLNQNGLAAGKFSPNGLIPPAITGLHNGDAIKAWLDNGIKYVVGDSSRPLLMNPTNEYWPLITNVSANGYAGLTVVPRWPLPIYYNCDVAACTQQEWLDTSGGWGTFTDLIDFHRTTYSRHLLSLRHDPFMYHQANMRYGDTNNTWTFGPVTGELSLLQIGTEVLAQEMMRLTTWPLVSKQHDDLALDFIARMTRDGCGAKLSWTLSSDLKSITGATVSSTNNQCSTPIPVTFPVSASTTATSTKEQLGSDPLTIWTTLSGSPVTFTLAQAIAL